MKQQKEQSHKKSKLVSFTCNK